ncbi:MULTISPECIES: CoA transferase subunit A [Tindallia]|uniref:Butyryl-CoA:acetoacetate CoA-transferase alpha subunit n=2 Tax=Tindallia TaxID=69894 RepID=A0A1H3IER3_9FIRM|nr:MULTISPECIES: CoA transferase subunit A [Tindallia]SDY25739.1 butyryl-CoA:acetoacetate CoA-transferase alpha subunit [Tindallia californiensis]SFH53882.1 butyryl-CoA:acetoacetate CoA-transferase alpha subunit [Tindallia magadiensis]
MSKVVSMDEALNFVKDGSTVMIPGFMGAGTPENLVDGLVKKNVKDLFLICTDTARPDVGIGKLIVNGQIKKLYASHIGTNPETGRMMNEGLIDVTLIPQGTLAERIRAGGAGLGGFLTPTGVGTVVEEGKQKMALDGKEYLLELPLRADVALIRGSKVDKKGNVWYNAATRNFNTHMATAADVVIVEACELVEVGEIDPNNVMTPGIFVDYIVKGE